MNLLNKLPYWFKAKTNKDSTTKQFLDVFSEEAKSLFFYTDKEKNKTMLSTYEEIDYKMVKAVCREFKTLTVNGEIIERADSQTKIVRSIEDKKQLYFYEKGVLYISNTDISAVVLVDNKKVDLMEHRVWGFDVLDEFGVILNMPRLSFESNKDYKKRLLSYKKTKGNGSIGGICSFVGHALGLNKSIIWSDSSNIISISDSNTICRHIFIDGIYHLASKSDDNVITVKADNDNRFKTITYFVGFDIESLNEKHLDIETSIDISNIAPIMWGFANDYDAYFIDEEVEDEYYKIAPIYDDNLKWLK